MVLHHAVSGAKSKAGAFAHGLGGVERIEDALRIAHSGAGVGELNHHFAAFAPEVDLKAPAANLLQCVHGIFDDLQKRLQELIGIAEHAGHGIAAIDA